MKAAAMALLESKARPGQSTPTAWRKLFLTYQLMPAIQMVQVLPPVLLEILQTSRGARVPLELSL